MADAWAQLIFALAEVNCLATNVYHEARGEPLAGQFAVAEVTLNRTRDRRYPDTVCEVVHERRQFSWTSRRQAKPRDAEAWAVANDVARRAYFGVDYTPRLGHRVTHFHSISVSLPWRGARLVARVGNHYFYEVR